MDLKRTACCADYEFTNCAAQLINCTNSQFAPNIPSKKLLDKIPAQDLDQLAQDLPKILPKVTRLCRLCSGQDHLTHDMARSRPPGKILASSLSLALIGKNLTQELFARLAPKS